MRYLSLTLFLFHFFLSLSLPQRAVSQHLSNEEKIQIIQKHWPSIENGTLLFDDITDQSTKKILRPFYVYQFFMENQSLPKIISGPDFKKNFNKIIKNSHKSLENYIVTLLFYSEPEYNPKINLILKRSDLKEKLKKLVSLDLILFIVELQNLFPQQKKIIWEHFSEVYNINSHTALKKDQLNKHIHNFFQKNKNYKKMISSIFIKNTPQNTNQKLLGKLILQMIGSENLFHQKALNLNYKSLDPVWFQSIMDHFTKKPDLVSFDFIRSKAFFEAYKERPILGHIVLEYLDHPDLWKMLQENYYFHAPGALSSLFPSDYWQLMFNYFRSVYIKEGEKLYLSQFGGKERTLFYAMKIAPIEDWPIIASYFNDETKVGRVNLNELDFFIRKTLFKMMKTHSNYIDYWQKSYEHRDSYIKSYLIFLNFVEQNYISHPRIRKSLQQLKFQIRLLIVYPEIINRLNSLVTFYEEKYVEEIKLKGSLSILENSAHTLSGRLSLSVDNPEGAISLIQVEEETITNKVTKQANEILPEGKGQYLVRCVREKLSIFFTRKN